MKRMMLSLGCKAYNRRLDTETAHSSVSTFCIFLIICASVAVHCAQFLSAQRYTSESRV
jgi:hypothetical protein